MRTAFVIEILQIFGGLAIVFFAGKRLLAVYKRSEIAKDVAVAGDSDADAK